MGVLGRRHLAHLYRDETAAIDVASSFAEHALRRGGAVLLIGSPERCDGIVRRLSERGVDTERCAAAGRLSWADGAALLAAFSTPQGLDEAAFRSALEPVLQPVQRAAGGHPCFAWGEMVDMLCARGELASAKRLEDFWERLIAETGIELLCSYDLAFQPAGESDPVLDTPWGVHEEILTDAVLAPLASRAPTPRRSPDRERR